MLILTENLFYFGSLNLGLKAVPAELALGTNSLKDAARSSLAETQGAARAAYEQRVRNACHDRRHGALAVVLLRDLPAEQLYGGDFNASGRQLERAFRNRALSWLGSRGQWRQAIAAFDDELKTAAAAAASSSAAFLSAAVPPPLASPSTSSAAAASSDSISAPYYCLPPDGFTWSAALAACGEAKPPQWRAALELLERMQAQQTVADAAAWAEAAAGLVAGPVVGAASPAVWVAVPVAAVHVGLAMKACSRAGRVTEVLELLDQTVAITQSPPTLIL